MWRHILSEQGTEYNAKGMTVGVGGIQEQTKGPSSSQGGAGRLPSHLNDQCGSIGGRRRGGGGSTLDISREQGIYPVILPLQHKTPAPSPRLTDALERPTAGRAASNRGLWGEPSAQPTLEFKSQACLGQSFPAVSRMSPWEPQRLRSEPTQPWSLPGFSGRDDTPLPPFHRRVFLRTGLPAPSAHLGNMY